jgi:hypothetical protein
MTFVRPLLLLVVCVVCACSPTLNWRDTQPEGSGLRLTFPCKPASRVRELVLAGQPAAMHLHSCDAGDATFALTATDLTDPSFVAAALGALEQSAVLNIDAAPASTTRAAFSAKGMTPSPAAQRLVLQGHLPDGTPVRQEAAFFSSGLRIYQATVLSKSSRPLAADAVDTFFDSIVVAR